MNGQVKLLAKSALQHLECEEERLDEMQVAAERLRENLRSRNQSSTIDPDIASEKATVTVQETVDARRRLKEAIAKYFRVPIAQTTALTLAEHCDDEIATEIRQRCQRLRSKAMKLSAISRANSDLASRLSQLLNQVFQTLRGEPCVPPLYGRDGHRRAA